MEFILQSLMHIPYICLSKDIHMYIDILSLKYEKIFPINDNTKKISLNILHYSN